MTLRLQSAGMLELETVSDRGHNFLVHHYQELKEIPTAISRGNLTKCNRFEVRAETSRHTVINETCCGYRARTLQIGTTLGREQK